jgi:hypothetical protein
MLILISRGYPTNLPPLFFGPHDVLDGNTASTSATPGVMTLERQMSEVTLLEWAVYPDMEKDFCITRCNDLVMHPGIVALPQHP